MRRFLQPPMRPVVYLKEFPFHLNDKAKQKVKSVGQFLGTILLTAFVTYIFLNNITPFGVTMHNVLGSNSENISDIGPRERVIIKNQNGQKIFYQKHDLVYFTTKMPFQFDTATVRIAFKNSYPDQTLSLGFQDQEVYHYNTKLIDVPLLNDLSWKTTGDNPRLYQRETHFGTVDEFLQNPPKDALIGTYAYETNIGDTAIQMWDYQAETHDTIIDTPLRGQHTIYVYLKNEPFKMIFEKQDLNWYEDPDIMTIKVYKDKDLVYEITADDDGVQDNSQRILSPQEIEIKNPGPDLPENGVYKIIIDATGDTIIKKIRTNLHKIVFANSLFPVGNSQVYGSLIASTSATTVYTNALLLSAITYHEAGVQDLTVGNQILHVDPLKSANSIIPQETISKVIIPKNDILLNGFQGYFAFNENHFFLPIPYRIIPITTKEDTKLVDYILADYKPSTKIADWQVNEITFDLHSAFIKNGRLTWIIKSPRLKENNRELLIGNIDIVFHKKPWL